MTTLALKNVNGHLKDTNTDILTDVLLLLAQIEKNDWATQIFQKSLENEKKFFLENIQSMEVEGVWWGKMQLLGDIQSEDPLLKQFISRIIFAKISTPQSRLYVQKLSMMPEEE